MVAAIWSVPMGSSVNHGDVVTLYHSGSRAANGARFSAGDEEDCYTSSGCRRGIWLTSESQTGPSIRSVELASDDIGPFEMTEDGDAHRTFLVPLDFVISVPTQIDTPAPPVAAKGS